MHVIFKSAHSRNDDAVASVHAVPISNFILQFTVAADHSICVCTSLGIIHSEAFHSEAMMNSDDALHSKLCDIL